MPYAQLDTACDRLREVCAEIPRFEIGLAGYGRFAGVIYMRPADPTPIQAVGRKILAAFPDYPPYGGKFGSEITPHLTIAQFDPGQQPENPANYTPLRFEVDRLHVWYGPDDEDLPWLTYDVIHLKS